MRRFISVFFCSGLLVCSLLAQTFVKNVHRLQPDTLDGTMYAFVDAGASGKDILWDFRYLTEPVETQRRISLVQPHDTTQFCIHEHHTRTYYLLQGDTLFSTGYENALTRMDYSRFEPVLRFPFGYGDTLSGCFAGTGEYCHRLPFTVSGYMLTEADGVGTLLLPDAKVDKVLRLHMRRTWTEIAGDSVDMQEDIWRWYVARSSHPLLEALRLTQRTTMGILLPYTLPMVPQHSDGNTPTTIAIASRNPT